MRLAQLFFGLLFFSTLQLPAQELETNNFVRYTTANGLSGNNITGLVQDARGYVWASTHTGLNRFNGNRFVQFHSTADTLSLASEHLTDLEWISSQQLGVYSGAGLHIVNTKTGKTKNVFVPYHRKQYLYKFNTIHGARGDEKGNLYILTRSGFYHFLHEQLVWRFDYYKDSDLEKTHFHFGGELFDYDEKRLLLKTIGGLYLYDKEKRTLQHPDVKTEPLLAVFKDAAHRNYLFLQHKPGQLFVFKPHTDSLLYVNTATQQKVFSKLPFVVRPEDIFWRSRLYAVNDSVLYLTGHTSGFYKLHLQQVTGKVQMEKEKWFASFLCSALLIDQEQQLWVGTNKGLFYHNPQRSVVKHATVPINLLDSFPNLRLSDVCTYGNDVYASARGEAGLLLFDKKSFHFKKQLLLDKKVSVNNSIAAMALSGKSLLLGSFRSPYLFDVASQKTKPLLPTQWEDGADWTNEVFGNNKGEIWLSGGDHIYHYNASTQNFTLLPIHQSSLTLPVFIRQDKDGFLWMASHGLARYNPKQQRFDVIIDSFPFLKMPDRQVGAFAFDDNNVLWFSSSNNGLIGYDQRTKTFRHFSTQNGLPDNQVIDVLPLRNKLWVTCFSGLACLDIVTGNIVSFGKEDGFPDMNILHTSRMFYDSATGEVYVPFATALARFHPQQLLGNRRAPKLFIETLTLNGDATIFLPEQRFITSWNRNDVSIAIGSIAYSSTGSQQFSYRIGDDKNAGWVELGTQPQFNIAGLSPGVHHIQVRTTSANNQWAAQVHDFYLEVTPPFWLRTWFLVVMGVLFLYAIYALVRWRTHIVQRKEMVNTQIQKLKADDYKAQFELEQISHYFSSSLADKKTEEEVLWDVAQNLIGRMNYEDCMIYGWNEEKTKMIQKAAYGPKGKPELITANVFDVLPGQGIVGEVMVTKQPVLIKDTRLNNRYRVDDDFRLSEITVPIIHNDELLGVIDSEHHQLNYFTERDIKILTTIATLIGNKLKQLESEQSLAAKQQELAGINEQLAEARLSALQAQMNPHFVFNALNSIKRMILDSDNERASRYLSKFALMIRMTLNHSKEIFVTLDENIQYIKSYLEMEQLRFGDSFTYNIYMDDNIDGAETTIPSMMIQPLVENAIWHGLMQAEGEKKISISFTEDDGQITCVVEDNGIGIRQSERLKHASNSTHRSVGLENLRKRIKIMNDKYDMGFHFSIVDLAEEEKGKHGTRVVLQFTAINV